MREPRTIASHPMTAGVYSSDQQPEARRPWLALRLIRAAAEGVLPLVILTALLALFWEISVIGRVFSLQYGIDMVQRVEIVSVGGGLVVALIVYLITAMRTLQSARAHQRIGAVAESLVMLCFLALSALVTLVPLFIALKH